MSLIKAIQERDPAKPTFMEVVLAYNGFHAVMLHHVSRFLWDLKLKALARGIANISRILTSIEIHPQATLGERVFIDHGIGVVIGQTAVIEDDVTIYHGVTLGGKGQPDEAGKRHPTIKKGAFIGAGAQVLGNITIGENARVGANAVVTKCVPDNCVIVGNPGRLMNCSDEDLGRAYGLPSEIIDPMLAEIEALKKKVKALEGKTKAPAKKVAKVPAKNKPATKAKKSA